MDINKLIKDFMKNKSEGSEGYEKDILIFIKYLNIPTNVSIIEEVLQGVRTKKIIDSIDYYISTGPVTSINTVKRYTCAIAEFFKYIISEKYIDNISFYNEIVAPTVATGSYRGLINEAISNNKKLKEGDMFEIYCKDEIQELIENCNEAIEFFQAENQVKKRYSSYIAALCLKLISYTGTLYRGLRKINMSNDIIDFNVININGFDIHLPRKLNSELKDYIKVRSDILVRNKKNSEYLFITFDGEQLSKQTSIISGFLATCTGRNDLNGLIKYAIREMMINSINDSVITKFTGVGEEILRQCVDAVNKDGNEINWNRYLDSKLLAINTFDYL